MGTRRLPDAARAYASGLLSGKRTVGPFPYGCSVHPWYRRAIEAAPILNFRATIAQYCYGHTERLIVLNLSERRAPARRRLPKLAFSIAPESFFEYAICLPPYYDATVQESQNTSLTLDNRISHFLQQMFERCESRGSCLLPLVAKSMTARI